MSTDIKINRYTDVLIAKDDEGKEHYVGIYHDDNPSWIQEEYPLGRFLTWRDGTYYIGEKHNYRTKKDYWIDIIRDFFYNSGKANSPEGMRFLLKYSQLLFDNCYIRLVNREELLAANDDCNPNWAKDYDYFVCDFNYDGSITDEYPVSTDKIADMTFKDMESMMEFLDHVSDICLEELAVYIPDFIYYKIYLRESGDCEWSIEVPTTTYWYSDNSIGFWSCTKEEAEKGGLNVEKDWKKLFYECITEYIEELNELETGNTWNFAHADKEYLDSFMESVNKYSPGLWSQSLRQAILDHSDDSCSGFYGPFDDLVREYCRDEDLEIVGVVHGYRE